MWRTTTLSRDGAPDLSLFQRGDLARPAAVLVPGLLGDVDALEPFAQELEPSHALWSWSPRGLSGSGAADDYGFDGWLEDLTSVLDEIGGPALLVGWSAGGRVAVEAAAQWPERCTAVVSVAGTWGRPFEQLLHSVVDPGSSLFAMAAQAASGLRPGTRLPAWAQELARAALVTEALRLFGVSAETTDSVRLRETLARTLDNDLHALLSTWRGVSRRCQSGPPAQLAVPSLWFAGDHDVLTPVDDAQFAAHGLDAQLVVVPGGTHFLPLEQPELLRLHVRRFLKSLPDG